MISPEQNALTVLGNGGVIVHATEGVFGLACGYEFESAVDRIAALKRRDRARHPFLLLACEIEQLADIVDLEQPYKAAALATWPGPVTWIFPILSSAYNWLGGDDQSVAVRITAHPQARILAREHGLLISTSANRHGAPAALTLAEAQGDFGSAVDFYLPGELLTPGHPSRIGDARNGKWLR